jgi:hypothetical protein
MSDCGLWLSVVGVESDAVIVGPASTGEAYQYGGNSWYIDSGVLPADQTGNYSAEDQYDSDHLKPLFLSFRQNSSRLFIQYHNFINLSR